MPGAGFARLRATHQTLPLTGGWWRTRAGASHVAQRTILHELGLHEPRILPDGSQAWRPSAAFLSAALDPNEQQPHADCSVVLPSQLDDDSRALIEDLLAAIAAQAAPAPRPPEWMAILNLTPDSFSDGGSLDAPEAVLAQARTAVEQGASWLDLGAESTRPGAAAIPAEDQLQRLLPAIELLLPLGVPLSIDTRSAQVADACLSAGARMINDVSGLADPEMAAVCARHQSWLTLMHMRGVPETMQEHCTYSFVLGEVADELAPRAAAALEAGVAAERLMLDPGIGFAKTAQQSRSLLAQVGSLRALGLALLVGPSRKSFQAELLPERAAADRDCGTAGAASSCIHQGVTTLRLHSGQFWDAGHVAAGIFAAAPHPALPPGEPLDVTG